jgi:hypothetical protein
MGLWPGTRADSFALELSERPVPVLGAVLALNLGLAGTFAAAGRLAGDEALLFREGTPGTLLSFAQLLLIAAVAGAIHVGPTRSVPGGGASGGSRRPCSPCSRSTRSPNP